jgi:N4-gp56 family major capsid protein
MAGQLWSVDALGGYMYSDELSEVLRVDVQPTVKFRQLCDAKDGTQKGLNRGDQFNWNIYRDVVEAGDDLDETITIPETNFVIETASLTLGEIGNSVPYSGKLNNFSKQPVEEIVKKALKNDVRKVLDSKAHAQFNNTDLTVQATSGTSTTAVTAEEGGCTITNDVAFGKDHVKAIVDVLKERNIPGYAGDEYYAIAWPTTYRTMKNDLESIKQYIETGFGFIMNGEIGRYEGVRFIEQSGIAKGGAVDSTTWNYLTADAWNNAKSDWIFFLGEDTVAEAIAIPEEMRGKIPTDYGRSRGVAWYYLGGFGLVHTGSNASSNSRIAKWESAA